MYEEAVNGNMLPKNQSNIASAEEKVQNSANIQVSLSPKEVIQLFNRFWRPLT